MFAAAIALCGRGDPRTAQRIARIPIWVVHGAKDRVVGCSCARTMVQALIAQGGLPRYTEYPDSGHEAGFRALNDPQFFSWLFQQHQ
jgi:predicted peptidase